MMLSLSLLNMFKARTLISGITDDVYPKIARDVGMYVLYRCRLWPEASVLQALRAPFVRLPS